MANIDPPLRRNKDFAATGAHEAASIVAKYPVYVITCLDPRTDPSAFLGLELGDAMVIRNAGGRVSPGVLKDLPYIGYLSRTLVPGGPRFEVAVVHHNQCARTSSPTKISAAASLTSSAATMPRLQRSVIGPGPGPGAQCRRSVRLRVR